MTTPRRVLKAEPVDVAWGSDSYPGALSGEGSGRSLAIRTNRSLIVGLVLEAGGERLKVVGLEQSLTKGFRVAKVEVLP